MVLGRNLRDSSAVETDISFAFLLQGMEGQSVYIKRQNKSHGFLGGGVRFGCLFLSKLSLEALSVKRIVK